MVDNELIFYEAISETPDESITVDIAPALVGGTAPLEFSVYVAVPDVSTGGYLFFTLTDENGVEVYDFKGAIEYGGQLVAFRLPAGIGRYLTLDISYMEGITLSAAISIHTPHYQNFRGGLAGWKATDLSGLIYESFSYVLSDVSKGTIPFYLYSATSEDLTLIVDWGDGTSEYVEPLVFTPTSSSNTLYSHSYEESGDYTVTVYSDAFNKLYLTAYYYSNEGASVFNTSVTKILSPLPALAGTIYRIKYSIVLYTYSYTVQVYSYSYKLDYGLAHCSKLKEIPEDLFLNTTKTELDHVFLACTSLSEIPENLLATGTTITQVPGLFMHCTALTEIPENLFANNTAITSFAYTFSGCKGITEIPETLFSNNVAVTNFNYTFSYTYITEIPETLFSNNVAVTSFNHTFSYMPYLAEIPETLFSSNTEAISFLGTFSRDKITEIPENLFTYNKKATTFQSTFQYCTKITGIPENLFANNPAITSVQYCFGYCTALTSIPSSLLENCPKITNASYLFANSSALTEAPSTLFSTLTNLTTVYYAFYNTSLEDFVFWIPSEVVTNAKYFCPTDSDGEYSRTVYVIDGSTTQATFEGLDSSYNITVGTYDSSVEDEETE